MTTNVKIKEKFNKCKRYVASIMEDTKSKDILVSSNIKSTHKQINKAESEVNNVSNNSKDILVNGNKILLNNEEISLNIPLTKDIEVKNNVLSVNDNKKITNDKKKFKQRIPTKDDKSILEANGTEDQLNSDINNKETFIHKKPNKVELPKTKLIGNQIVDGDESYIIMNNLAENNKRPIYLVKEEKTKTKYVVKILKKGIYDFEDEKKYYFREINIQQSLSHKNILKLYKYFEDDTNYYLLLEYAEGGDLSRRIGMNEKELAKYISDLLLALNYLHTNNIIYRDLKPENIFIMKDGQLKLADFGGSIKIDPNNKRRLSVYGTNEYISPEMHCELSYYKSTDMWSLGCLVYEMLYGETPFYKGEEQTERELLFSIVDMKFNFPDTFSLKVKDFISKLLVINPNKRMTIEKAFNHPWITGTKLN